MVSISNDDYRTVLRSLRALIRTNSESVRDYEDRRQARRLLSKLQRRDNRQTRRVKEKDNNFPSSAVHSPR